MIIVSSCLIVVYLLIFIVTRSKKCDENLVYDKKEHPLQFLYPMSDFLMKIFRKILDKEREEKQLAQYKELYCSDHPDQKMKDQNRRNTAISLAILFLALLFTLVSTVMEGQESLLIQGNKLKRPELGEGRTQIELEWQSKLDGSKEPLSSSVNITLDEIKVEGKELETLFAKAQAYINEQVIGTNESMDCIYSDLNFIKSIPGTDITVTWNPENYKWIYTDGSIREDVVPKEGVKLNITAVMSYYHESREYTFQVVILPEPLTKEESFIAQLTAYINQENKTSSSENWFVLPDFINNNKVIWSEEKANNGIKILALGLFAILFLQVNVKKELERKLKKRELQLALDYPDLTEKFLLLLGAGLTIKGAWERIVSEFERNEEKKKRYLYQEMLLTRNELAIGLSESRAYEAFGKRCRQISYLRFSTILVQNLKRGAKGTLPLLELEAKEAFHERKETAKRIGEEAGTKLLLPMMGMLMIVFAIILIPALSSF